MIEGIYPKLNIDIYNNRVTKGNDTFRFVEVNVKDTIMLCDKRYTVSISQISIKVDGHTLHGGPSNLVVYSSKMPAYMKADIVYDLISLLLQEHNTEKVPVNSTVYLYPGKENAILAYYLIREVIIDLRRSGYIPSQDLFDKQSELFYKAQFVDGMCADNGDVYRNGILWGDYAKQPC